MPRALVLGNGNLLATFDQHLLLRDFYFPHVGLEDHTLDGTAHRVGVFVENAFSWLDDGNWQMTPDYASETMVGDSLATNTRLGIEIRFTDFVHPTRNILVRSLTVSNLAQRPREIKIFVHHDFNIAGSKTKDTAQYEPELDGILHYRLQRYFLISGQWQDRTPLDQFTVGKSGYAGKEGTFRDAEDGQLHGNPIDQGSVDSTIGFRQTLAAGKQASLHYWIAAGTHYQEIRDLHEFVIGSTPQKLCEHTTAFWHEWVNKEHRDFADLPENVIDLYKKSLLIIRTQIDNNGAILAANDSDIMRTNRDNYSYMWPRDGALTSATLCKAGYAGLARQFLEFTAKLVTRDGYLLNKYNTDGSLGSSWHPKFKDGEIQLPIQEDETALFLRTFAEYYEATHDLEFLQRYFHATILPVGEWLQQYRDIQTGLPLPSYDLWEQNRAVSTYTASCVFAGLEAAAKLCEWVGHAETATAFWQSAEAMREAICTHLYSVETKRFVRAVSLREGSVFAADMTIDASLSFVWQMGVLPVDDERVMSTMQMINERLSITSDIGGLARFENDHYQFDNFQYSHQQFTGNPWIITTLWAADFQIASAKSLAELQKTVHTLAWTFARANSAGILPEQVHPVSGIPLSVAPLTWSHAAFVSTVLRYLGKYSELRDS